MVAGRELNALVAKEVMGWERIQMKHPPGGVSWPTPPKGFDVPNNRFASIPLYSTSIAAAWEVVEKLRDSGLTVDICSDAVDEEWEVEVWRPEEENEYGQVRVATPGYADTAPHAICLAALAAVGALPPAQEEE